MSRKKRGKPGWKISGVGARDIDRQRGGMTQPLPLPASKDEKTRKAEREKER